MEKDDLEYLNKNGIKDLSVIVDEGTMAPILRFVFLDGEELKLKVTQTNLQNKGIDCIITEQSNKKKFKDRSIKIHKIISKFK